MFYVYLEKTGEEIGGFLLDEQNDTINIHIELYDKYQRKGYGSIIYDWVDDLANKLHKRFTPSETQTTASKGIWAKRLR